MWNQIYYNNSLKEWGISILIIIGALLASKLITTLNRLMVKQITTKRAKLLDEAFFIAIEKPVLLGIMLLSIWFASSRLQLELEVRDLIKEAYDALIVLTVTWFFVRSTSALIEEDTPENRGKTNRRRFRIDSIIFPVIKRAILVIIWLIGIVMALNNLGISVVALMSTLGIGGIAFALAAQDTIKNIFGGITILTDKPFRIGDTIKIDSVEGSVVDIGLRSTRILNYDKRVLTIPNYKLMDSFVLNISSENGRRIVMELGLVHNTSAEKMEQAISILRDIPNRIPEVSEKDLVASFTDYTELSLNLTFIYFIPRPTDIYETRTKVNLEILRAFQQVGVSFPPSAFRFPPSAL